MIQDVNAHVMHSNIVKITLGINLSFIHCSSFGNELEPTSNVLEVMFSICIVLCGLTLFTLLVGNIQVTFELIFSNDFKSFGFYKIQT